MLGGKNKGGLAPLYSRKIKKLREKRQLTQKQLAELSGISESALHSYELGDRKPKKEILERIAMAIDIRTDAGKPLPSDLASLAREPGRRLSIADPATNMPYVYQTTGDHSYRLCAVFTTDTAQESRKAWIDQDWLHGPGRHCFDRKADRKKD